LAERKTLARPYAEAVFQMAKDKDQLTLWSAQLSLLAGMGANEDIAALATNPEINRDDVADLVINSAGKKLNKDGANLVHLLLENGRLTILPEISELFETYKAEHEGSVEAEVISAFELADKQLKNISDALKKKLGREVKLVSHIDESLVGGVVIRAGDLVIDGSVTGYLQALSTQINR
jgi:F-type H+-transporting ATPase subunit delta